MDSVCRIELLGGLRVTAGGHVATHFRTRKSAELLAYLACELPRAYPREHLIALLWPDADADSGRHSLSMALSALRPHLEPPGAVADGAVLRASRDTVGLSSAAVTTDVAEFESHLRAAERETDQARSRAELASAVELYRGELLPGLYEDWVFPRQRRLAELFFGAAQRLIGELDRRREPEQALQVALRAVQEDPLREELQREVIRLCLATGRPEAAAKQYHDLAHRLRAELDVDPGPQTQDLLARAGLPLDPPALPGGQPRPLRAAGERARRPAAGSAGLRAGAPGQAELPPRAAPLEEPASAPNNLPCPVTSFIGREKEVAEVRRLLSTARMVTLTGAGGCGKSRLALEVADALLGQFADGVWLVELAPLSDPAFVVQAVLSGLKARRLPGKPGMRALVEHLRTRTLLLVLDNCEHVLESCRQVASSVLRACPRVRILATSREALGIPGDVCHRVPPLTTPEPGVAPTVEGLERYEAVRLFADRSAAASPGFTVTARHAPAVAQICERLDGIPLAIEMAAAHAGALSVEQIARRLDDRFDLLERGSGIGLPHHRTLRALFDWSYDLLGEPERALLRRLTVFAGGWTLDAAEAVCGDGGLAPALVAATLSRLVGRSLVSVVDAGEEPRYRLLETTRAFAAEHALPEEHAALPRRLAEYWLEAAEEADRHGGEACQRDWFERVEAERDNLRAALDWCCEQPEAETGLRLATALCRFWYMRGYVAEGRRRMAQALANRETATLATQAKALNGAGSLAVCQGDYEAARGLHEESLRLFRQIGNTFGVAVLLNDLGTLAQHQSDAATARANYEESLALMRELDNHWGVAYALNLLGAAASQQGDPDASYRFHEEGLALARREALKDMVAYCAEGLGALEYERGRFAEAQRLYQESLAASWELGDREGVAGALELIALAAGAQGFASHAARLSGAAQALRHTIDLPFPPRPAAGTAQGLDTARAALGDEGFATAAGEGRAMPLDRAVAYALGATD